jgi:hypothetical protein
VLHIRYHQLNQFLESFFLRHQRRSTCRFGRNHRRCGAVEQDIAAAEAGITALGHRQRRPMHLVRVMQPTIYTLSGTSHHECGGLPGSAGRHGSSPSSSECRV